MYICFHLMLGAAHYMWTYVLGCAAECVPRDKEQRETLSLLRSGFSSTRRCVAVRSQLMYLLLLSAPLRRAPSLVQVSRATWERERARERPANFADWLLMRQSEREKTDESVCSVRNSAAWAFGKLVGNLRRSSRALGFSAWAALLLSDVMLI